MKRVFSSLEGDDDEDYNNSVKKQRLISTEICSSLTDFMPMELWMKVAETDESTYRAMLSFPEFARRLTVSLRMDYRVDHFGHYVVIEPYNHHELTHGNTVMSIRWYRKSNIPGIDDNMHRLDGPAFILCYRGVEEQHWMANGSIYRKNGLPQFEDVETPSGAILQQRWFSENRLHRDRDPAIICYASNGNITYKEYIHRGNVHNTNGPAILRYDLDGRIGYETWVQDGARHRTDGPAEITYYSNGHIHCETWMQDDVCHRTDGPARILYDVNGHVTKETWTQNGVRHRTDGPAVIVYDVNGHVIKEKWIQDGHHHRIDGPSSLQYAADGSVYLEKWKQRGKFHRENGPAICSISPNGDRHYYWFQHNNYYRDGDEPTYVVKRKTDELRQWRAGQHGFYQVKSEEIIPNPIHDT